MANMPTSDARKNVLTPPPYLSPSSMGTFVQCPQKFKFNKIDLIPDAPTKETLLGNFVHETLEALYALEPDQRTLPMAKSLAGQVWEVGDWASRVQRYVPKPDDLRLFRWSAWWCIENLWKLEDPTLIEPAGIEVEVNGLLGGIVTVKGFIDRYSVNDGKITISDYKTGKTPRGDYVADKFKQLQIYGALAKRQFGLDVERIELLYLKDGVRLEASFTDADIRSVSDYAVAVFYEIESACLTENFPTHKSRLCDWCSYKSICPAWRKK